MTDEHPPEYTEEYGIVGFERVEDGVASVIAVRADPSEGSVEVLELAAEDQVDDRSESAGPGETVGLVYTNGDVWGDGEITVLVVYLHEESGDWWTVEADRIDVNAVV